MTDWYLRFRQSHPITIEACERALSEVVGGHVTTTYATFHGNPRDFYSRAITITALRGGDEVRIEMHLLQSAQVLGDPDAFIDAGVTVLLRAPSAPYATKRATWDTLRDALAKIGCTDCTGDLESKAIVDEATTAGDVETAERLRAQLAAVREAEAARLRRVEELRVLDAAEAARRAPGSPAPTRTAETDPALANQPARRSTSLLISAASSGDLEVATRVLETDAGQVDEIGAGGYTALMAAAKEGHIAMIKLLLRRGADPQRRTARGETALHRAALAHAREGFDRLVEAGCRISDERDDGWTPFDIACANNRVAMVQALLERGVPIDRRVGASRATALILACTYGATEVASLLREHGADASLVDNEGKTADERAHIHAEELREHWEKKWEI